MVDLGGAALSGKLKADIIAQTRGIMYYGI